MEEGSVSLQDLVETAACLGKQYWIATLAIHDCLKDMMPVDALYNCLVYTVGLPGGYVDKALGK